MLDYLDFDMPHTDEHDSHVKVTLPETVPCLYTLYDMALIHACSSGTWSSMDGQHYWKSSWH